MTRYTEDFKKSIVKKILSNENTSLRHIAKENGLAFSTTHGWLRKYGSEIDRPKELSKRSPNDWTLEERFNIRMTAEVNASIARGENPNDQNRKLRNELTFEALFNIYLEQHSKIHKKTWKEDIDRYNLHLKSWEARKLSSITKQDIQKLHKQVGHNNGIYAANRLLALLSSLFTKAIEDGLWEDSSPTSGIKRYKEKTRDRFLQAEELPRFFQALAEETNISIRDYVLISLLTGARRSNVLAMQWKHISFDRGEWYIPETKNGESQTVTLSQEALTILKTRALTKISPFVFTGPGKTGHLAEPKKGWQRILIQANIENLRLHDLRRTLGSWQAKTGASLAIIGKSLNHKSPVATAIYARLDLEPVRASIEKATQAMLDAADIKGQLETSSKEY